MTPQIPLPSDDYLWNRSGQGADDLLQLERALGTVRDVVPIPRLPILPARSRRTSRLLPGGLAAAALVMLAVGGVMTRVWLTPWTITTLAGAPMVQQQAVGAERAVEAGHLIETDARSRASLRVGVIGVVEIDPDSRVRVITTNRREHRLALERGRLRAAIDAPPRWFVVDTPGATAIDLGCAYTLEVGEAGDTTLRVEEGWVELDAEPHEAIVPAGAAAHARAGRGPGSPYYLDASERFRRSLAIVDFGTVAEAGAALAIVLQESRPRDSLTLLSLLRRLDGTRRAEIYPWLARLLPPPPGVTREAIVNGDAAAIDRWWDALALERPLKLYPRLWRFGG